MFVFACVLVCLRMSVGVYYSVICNAKNLKERQCTYSYNTRKRKSNIKQSDNDGDRW